MGKTDSVIRSEGMNALFDKLGLVDAEKFIMLINKDPFDYTTWQKDLYKDLEIKTLAEKATSYCSEKN